MGFYLKAFDLGNLRYFYSKRERNEWVALLWFFSKRRCVRSYKALDNSLRTLFIVLMEQEHLSGGAKTFKPARRLQRQHVVECLYMWEMQNDVPIEALLCDYFAEKEADKTPLDFVERCVKGTVNYCEQIDAIIRKKADNWSFNRIAKTDLAILRLAIYELLFCKDTPSAVVINEAIELSKLYSSVDAKRFINGILDQVSKERNGN